MLYFVDMARYRYSILLIFTFVGAWALGRYGDFDVFISSIASINATVYSFVAGAMYSFSFTAGFAVLLFSNLTIPEESLFMFSLMAAFGGLLADLLIFRFIKDMLFNELGVHTKKLIAKATRNKFTKVFLSIVGAVIIASPFPDEIGLACMGLSKISFWRMATLTFCLDVLGCYLVMSAVANFV